MVPDTNGQDPPLKPPIPPDPLKWKCENTLLPPPPLNLPFYWVNQFWLECLPCNGAPLNNDPGIFPWLNGPIPGNNPNPNSVGCVHSSKAACVFAGCPNPIGEIIPVGGGDGDGNPPDDPADLLPGGTTGRPTGPITGGNVSHQCIEVREICLEDLEKPIAEQRVLNVTKTCSPAGGSVPGTSIPNAGSTTSNNTNTEVGLSIIFGQVYPDFNQCLAACTPQFVSFPEVDCSVTGPITGGGGPQTTNNEPGFALSNEITGSPETASIINPESSQQPPNANVIRASEIIAEEDYRELRKGITSPKVYDPIANFFKVDSDDLLKLVSRPVRSRLFNRKVALEVSEMLLSKNSNDPWNEITLQNLSDYKISESMPKSLTSYFNTLRSPGGAIIGDSSFLNCIRRHLLEGTINEFDESYLREIGEIQKFQKFDVLERPKRLEHAQRLAISYLKNKFHTFVGNSNSSWIGFQTNRMRPLNEDVDMNVPVTLLSGSEKDLFVLNNGIPVEKLSALAATTPPSVGDPSSLNIGDGGGYYMEARTLENTVNPIPTRNILNDSYYAPSYVRNKVLDLLGVDSNVTITAKSLQDNNEFTVNDAGASAVKPLFFGIDLGSVSGETSNNILVESYSATYSLIEDEDAIQRHVNNNALNIPMLCIDYRDPLYRYILDTSTVTASMFDFNLNDFRDKGLNSIGARFVRNIPFGFIVTPVAGGRYNPFNGTSTLTDTSQGVHTRSMSVLAPPDAAIDGATDPMFRAYNLNKDDGVNRVGYSEPESTQNIGYRYVESDFVETFYNSDRNTYETSSLPPSTMGTSYMLREVLDYLVNTYGVSEVTWFDIFSRMPVTRFGETFYDITPSFLDSIANGFRNGVVIKNVPYGANPEQYILPEDDKTIISLKDRKGVAVTPI